MKTMSSSELITKFIEYSEIEAKTKLNGDYKLGNKYSKKLYKIFIILKKDNNLARNVLKELLKTNSIRARSIAAIDALRLNIYVDEALKVLNEVANMKEIGILSFGPSVALKIWKEKGYLDS